MNWTFIWLLLFSFFLNAFAGVSLPNTEVKILLSGFINHSSYYVSFNLYINQSDSFTIPTDFKTENALRAAKIKCRFRNEITKQQAIIIPKHIIIKDKNNSRINDSDQSVLTPENSPYLFEVVFNLPLQSREIDTWVFGSVFRYDPAANDLYSDTTQSRLQQGAQIGTAINCFDQLYAKKLTRFEQGDDFISLMIDLSHHKLYSPDDKASFLFLKSASLYATGSPDAERRLKSELSSLLIATADSFANIGKLTDANSLYLTASELAPLSPEYSLKLNSFNAEKLKAYLGTASSLIPGGHSFYVGEYLKGSLYLMLFGTAVLLADRYSDLKESNASLSRHYKALIPTAGNDNLAFTRLYLQYADKANNYEKYSRLCKAAAAGVIAAGIYEAVYGVYKFYSPTSDSRFFELSFGALPEHYRIMLAARF